MKKYMLCGLLFIVIFSFWKSYNTKAFKGDLVSPPSSYKEDSLKLNSYRFLISNMQGLEHSSQTGENVDDATSIDKDYFINNINHAVRFSRPLINKKIITIQDFNEYVLPYRINSSKIENWRAASIAKYDKKYQVGLIKDEQSLINTCNDINKELMTWFKFGSTNFDDEKLSYYDLCSNKKSSCIGMAYLAAYSLRGIGLPVAIDYAPVWGNINGGHTWNSLVTKSKKVNPFLGAESIIGSYSPLNLVSNQSTRISTYKKPGKVYRYTFSVQKKSLAYEYGSSTLPPELRESRIIDITKNYVPVKDIIVRTHSPYPKLLLISNYNSGGWVPIMATKIKNNQYVFKDMGRDLLYSTFSYNKGEQNSMGDPIYLDVSGRSTVLRPNDKKLMKLTINRTQSIENDQLQEVNKGWDYDKLTKIANGKSCSLPKNGAKYTLYYWKNSWQALGSIMAANNCLIFRSIPSNGLYLLSSKESISDERPFMIINNSIKWL
ncbi:hypothetical protein [Pedobacter sp. CFBP9032]|uniref:hypothetical protein n=1 Tax=Pedobacter sp. CFBP9032 TaxID=3096539 RepID=UPI002A6B6BB3|nr:hypothetical protein [Pedobacter sp. CFBP9032]MDY0905932.1 hypothetical protein [Pedobacter sp. CFBP9032]